MNRRSALFALLPLMIASTAYAQQTGGQPDDDQYTVNQLIIYGNDECPQSSGNEIVVCARKAENERYRIPETLRLSSDPANESWTSRVLAYETNSPYGQQACSPDGTAGGAGCTAQLIDAAYKERATAPGVRFGRLIEAERAKRLETIDVDAAEEQTRVEQIEREYMVRLERERQAETVETPLPELGDDTQITGGSEPE